MDHFKMTIKIRLIIGVTICIGLIWNGENTALIRWVGLIYLCGKEGN